MWTDCKAYFHALLNRVGGDENGQALVEYALIIALVSVVLIGALVALEGGIAATFNTIVTNL
jgi:pilus assembly protein Flp/PilA